MKPAERACSATAAESKDGAGGDDSERLNHGLHG